MFEVNIETSLNFDNILDISELDKNQKKLAGISKGLSSKLETYHQQLIEIAKFASQYDSKTGVKANGFRTFVKVNEAPLLPHWCYLTGGFLDPHTMINSPRMRKKKLISQFFEDLTFKPN